MVVDPSPFGGATVTLKDLEPAKTKLAQERVVHAGGGRTRLQLVATDIGVAR
jgi:hypothetical protein